MHAVVESVDMIPGQFSPETVARACSIDLQETASSNPYMREFEVRSDDELFSKVSLRVPSAGTEPTGILVLTPRESALLREGDVEQVFSFSSQWVDIDLRIPPEGIITHRETGCQRQVYLQFSLRSRLLRSIIVCDERT